MTDNDLRDLLASFTLHLRGERKSPQTIKTYTDGVRAFLSWCARNGIEPALDRADRPRTTAALDRYLRARSHHRLANTPALPDSRLRQG